MTQQQYYQQQFPPFPQQAPAQPQFQQPQFPQPQFPQAPVQQYPQQQPAQPAQPLAQGSLDDYFNQPSTGGGPAVSWKNKPNGTTVAGIVARDVTNADVQQDTDPQTKQAKFYRDGRPQFVMKVPLTVQATADFPEGEASLYVRGQLRDELVRAMGEAGCEGAPVAGAAIMVTLVERRQGNGTIPKNIFAVRYAAPNGSGAVQPDPVPSGAQQAAAPVAEQPQQPVQMPVPQAPAQQPVQMPVPQAPAQQPVQMPVPQFPQQQVPVAEQPGAPKPPADLDEGQQKLLAGLLNQ